MFLRIAGLINDSIVDGPGIRFTIFTQGCRHNCKNCHNPETHDLKGGRLIDIQELLTMIKKNILLDGVTISGGEPLLQPEPVEIILKEAKKLNLSTIVYTGYTWEQILQNKNKYIGILENTDYIIDGKFEENLKSLDLKFKGSLNQRIINVKKSIETGNVIEQDI